MNEKGTASQGEIITEAFKEKYINPTTGLHHIREAGNQVEGQPRHTVITIKNTDGWGKLRQYVFKSKVDQAGVLIPEWFSVDIGDIYVPDSSNPPLKLRYNMNPTDNAVITFEIGLSSSQAHEFKEYYREVRKDLAQANDRVYSGQDPGAPYISTMADDASSYIQGKIESERFYAIDMRYGWPSRGPEWHMFGPAKFGHDLLIDVRRDEETNQATIRRDSKSRYSGWFGLQYSFPVSVDGTDLNQLMNGRGDEWKAITERLPISIEPVKAIGLDRNGRVTYYVPSKPQQSKS